MAEDLVKVFLSETAQKLSDYDDACFQLVDDLREHFSLAGGLLSFSVDNHPTWYLHAVLLRAGIVHDGWMDGPLPVEEYLQRIQEWDPWDFLLDGKVWDSPHCDNSRSLGPDKFLAPEHRRKRRAKCTSASLVSEP